MSVISYQYTVVMESKASALGEVVMESKASALGEVVMESKASALGDPMPKLKLMTTKSRLI
jgi:hypothetical protein